MNRGMEPEWVSRNAREAAMDEKRERLARLDERQRHLEEERRRLDAQLDALRVEHSVVEEELRSLQGQEKRRELADLPMDTMKSLCLSIRDDTDVDELLSEYRQKDPQGRRRFACLIKANGETIVAGRNPWLCRYIIKDIDSKDAYCEDPAGVVTWNALGSGSSEALTDYASLEMERYITSTGINPRDPYTWIVFGHPYVIGGETEMKGTVNFDAGAGNSDVVADGRKNLTAMADVSPEGVGNGTVARKKGTESAVDHAALLSDCAETAGNCVPTSSGSVVAVIGVMVSPVVSNRARKRRKVRT